MKKNLKTALIMATILSAFSTSSQALAKTEGSYLGLDILRASAKTKTTKENSNNTDTYFNSSSKSSATGFGIHYKYAINMNNFFIAPGLFYEKIGSEAKVNNANAGWEQNLTVKDRYGVQLDLGYDLTKNFAAYIPIGYATSSYELKTKDYDNSYILKTTTTGSKSGLLYGVGFVFYPTDKISVNFEYSRTKLDLKSGGDVAIYGVANLKAKTTLDVLKVGASYHF